jgi:hypothetical protein
MCVSLARSDRHLRDLLVMIVRRLVRTTFDMMRSPAKARALELYTTSGRYIPVWKRCHVEAEMLVRSLKRRR